MRTFFLIETNKHTSLQRLPDKPITIFTYPLSSALGILIGCNEDGTLAPINNGRFNSPGNNISGLPPESQTKWFTFTAAGHMLP